MSRARHEGVTCDVCNSHNFPGKRFKCLICHDYDLCARCHDGGLASSNHMSDHAMQCILTKSEFDVHFAGDNMPFQRAQAYTCPVCNVMGLTISRMREHVLSEHGRSHREVICPVCATVPGYGANNRTSNLSSHIAADHSSATRANATEERIASIRRHLSPTSQAETASTQSQGTSTQQSSRRRTTGASTSSSNNGNSSAPDSRGGDVLRAAWLPSAARLASSMQSSQSSASASTSTHSHSAWGRLDPDVAADYSEYLSLHDSLMHGGGGSQPERLRERLAAEASRHADPNSPLYRYLSHPRFAGTGLRAAAAAAAGGTPLPPSGQPAPTQQSSTAGSRSRGGDASQFPSNYWECLMNTTAPPGEFVLPGLLDDDSLLSLGDEERGPGTSSDRARFTAELLLSLLDVDLGDDLLKDLDNLSSDSEGELSMETDV